MEAIQAFVSGRDTLYLCPGFMEKGMGSNPFHVGASDVHAMIIIQPHKTLIALMK